MAAIKKLMLDKILMKMKRFNMNELKQLFEILHLNLEWKDIINIVSECRLRLSVANVVSVVHQHLKDSDSVDETYHRVLLVDAIFHQNSQWWTVTIDKVNKQLLDKGIIRNNIEAMLNKLNIKAITYVMKCNKLFWVLIDINETKRKQTTVKLNKPYFFTIAPGKVFHVFYKPQNIENRLLKIVIKSVGASKCKAYSLSGKHLPSMVSLLEDKNRGNEKNKEVPTLLNNHKEEDVQEYVQKLFGEKRWVLNEFTINVESDMSVFSNSNPAGKMCKTKMVLKGDSIIDGVKDMMLSGVLQPPYPDWVTNLPVLGKNCVNINVHP
ncbi:uncharacterized protein LOC132950605 [Metopolophium dirhodum]|uniref:uncharacterized protein LOC132950605 n=1 Tax=Metopolophium dirhodum TaxID=44670 RepID=UPI0029905498|nr:uncharacterized protein LOC132950605 [Metopolophium dirhodum]